MEQSGHLQELEKRLGHAFRQPDLLEAALTHRSYSAETGQPDLMENQRLEFLGDAVLGVVSAEWLVAHRSDWREGTLTKVRSRLTNASALARVARRLLLGDFLRLGRGEEQSGGREKGALLADALEAVLGALWIDGGPEPVRRVFTTEFADEIAEAVEAGGDDNPKGDLQERLQQEWKESPRYELIEESGPPHARHFTVAVFRGNSRLGEGQGASKREAEIQAARCALARLDLPEP
jgi:ribonuclease-3